MLHFLIFVSFCWFFKLHAKKGQKLENVVKSWIFCLIWHETQTISKKSQKWENATSDRCFKFKKQFKINFLNFCQFLAHFEQKVAKSVFFCDFLKKYEFWSKFDIFNVFLVKFFIWKCILFMHFYEFVKKLCYK